MKKKTKPTQPRIVWERKPQTQVVPNKKAYSRKGAKSWKYDTITN